jgi:hypothetical protein
MDGPVAAHSILQFEYAFGVACVCHEQGRSKAFKSACCE